jgi:plastocyanin
MATQKISLGPSGPDPRQQSCRPGDEIVWTNNTGKTVTGLTLPTCVSPQTSPAPIASGRVTPKFTVNTGTKGEYPYSYVDPDTSQGTKNGTIDVGN